MGDWCISRKRYWGLPLPFWYCTDGHMTLIASKQDLLARAIRGTDGLEELHRPWIDEVVVPCATCGKEATRTTDVGDCWLDAGIVPFSTLGWRNDTYVEKGYAEGAGVGLTTADLPDHAHWETWFPADWISEMREQIRLWFYSMLFMSVVLDGRAPYRAVLTYERVNDETGRPMHKSWGNAIWFDDAVESMGGDVMRWMYAAQAPAANLNFGYGPANEVKRKLLTLWNTYRFFVDYASIEGFEPPADAVTIEAARPIDRWAITLTQQLVAECRAGYDTFDSPRVVRAIERYFNDLSNWYVRLSRARFYSSPDDADARAAFQTLWHCLVRLTQCAAPIMPFLAEELWSNLTSVEAGSPSSVHLSRFPRAEGEVDADILRAMDDVRTVVELGRAARTEHGLKVRQPLASVIVASADAAARARVAEHADIVAAELNVKDVQIATSGQDFVTEEIVPNFRVLGPKYGKDVGAIAAAVRDGRYERDGERLRVGEVMLEAGEFEVRTRAREGFAVVDGEGFALALDTEITPALALEGRARDTIRAIQDLRKSAGFALTDRIRVTYPAELADVFEAHGEWIARETLAEGASQNGRLGVERA
jgi:isoleucyl-tRNA synthetase